MIVSGNPDHGRRIAAEAGTFFNPECDRVIARVDDETDELLGGVIYTGFKGFGSSIGLHVAGFDPRWIDRDMLWITFAYPFEQLGCVKITATVPTRNQKAVLFNRKLGFVEEARVANLFPDGSDLSIMTMRKEDCRWLKRGSRGR